MATQQLAACWWALPSLKVPVPPTYHCHLHWLALFGSTVSNPACACVFVCACVYVCAVQPKIPEATRQLLTEAEDAAKQRKAERDSALWDEKMLATQTESACSAGVV